MSRIKTFLIGLITVIIFFIGILTLKYIMEIKIYGITVFIWSIIAIAICGVAWWVYEIGYAIEEA